MALVGIGQTYWPPLQLPGGDAAYSLGAGTVTFDSTTDRLAWVGRSPITDSLTTVYFRTGTVTTGSTLDIRIETVTNGRPTGTLFAANTNVTVAVADGDDNVWKTATLTAAASLTAGNEFAIIIVNSSGTPNMALSAGPLLGGPQNVSDGHYPLTLQDAGAGTWATVGNGFEWIVQFTTAGVTPLAGLLPLTGAGTITAYNSGTAPDERALRFQVPFKCRVAGMRVGMFNIAAGADFTFSLWDASGDVDGEALQQVAEDGDFAISTTNDGYVDLWFTTPQTLTINTTYYAGVRADTANNIGLGEFTTATVSNAIRAFHGVNAETYLATREWTAGTAGAWTTTTTTFPLIHLIIDQLDDGVNTGGGGQRVIGG
jgi:hypothetical protein